MGPGLKSQVKYDFDIRVCDHAIGRRLYDTEYNAHKTFVSFHVTPKTLGDELEAGLLNRHWNFLLVHLRQILWSALSKVRLGVSAGRCRN